MKKNYKEIQETVNWIYSNITYNGNTNDEGSWFYRKPIGDIEKLANDNYDVRDLQLSYVYAVDGYLKFWKRQPECNVSLQKFKEVERYVIFLKELSDRKEYFELKIVKYYFHN